MQKVLCMILGLMLMLSMLGCTRDDSDKVNNAESGNSKIYSEQDIESAIQVTKKYFDEEFKGCTLTEIEYIGDEHADEFDEWAEQYKGDEAIVLISSFDAGLDAAKVFEPPKTYSNWNWILVRNNGGEWRHVDHGY